MTKTRDKLVEVARQLFVHKGLEHTTMNDIANASSKGRRTIYTYFKNKKEIYNAVLERESDVMVETLREIVNSELPVVERMKQFLFTRLRQGNDVGSSYSSIKSLFKFDLRRMERIRRLVHDKEEALWESLISEGVRTGKLKPERCMLLGKFLINCLQGMDFNEIDSESASKMPQIHKALVEFIITDITVSEPRR